MFTEIEAKLRVDSLEPTRTRLETLGAQCLGDYQQEDIYFDDANETLVREDRALRLRSQVKGTDRQLYLTYKGPKQAGDVKVRREIEFQVGDAQAAQAFLEALAYGVAITIRKSRQVWRYGNCDIGLDHVPELGYFVEIEGPNSQCIGQVQSSLSLVQCLCATMYRVDPRHLLHALQCLAAGQIINRIQVDPTTRADARLALDRMLGIK